MNKIFKILLLVIFIISFSFNFNFVFAESKSDYFIVTAYYSPLPNQNYYLKGNYQDELRLNGMGIAGASGVGVYEGMIAAPSNYLFGTKIYLEGLGVGSVEDRGGAIVNAGKRGYEYDRIDIWMGYGDEGLRRALYWGKRKIIGKIVSSSTKETINIDNIPSPSWVTKNLKKIPNIFNIGLGIGSDKNMISKLQEFLLEIGIYNGEISGVYNNDLIDLVYEFQIANELIEPGELYGAGYWGNKTRNLFLKKYLQGEFDKKTTEEIKNELKETNKLEEKFLIFDSFSYSYDENISLQTILKELGLYNGEFTGKYDDYTIDIIYDFQVESGILSNVYEPGAGVYGPKTRAALKNKYELYKDEQEKEKLEEIRKKELEEKFKRLEELATKKAEKELNAIGTHQVGDVSNSVRQLQLKLKNLGYFNYKDTAYFGNITKTSVLSFQIANGVVSNENDLGAGIFGPRTREKLKIVLKEKYLAEMLQEENIENELVAMGIVGM